MRDRANDLVRLFGDVHKAQMAVNLVLGALIGDKEKSKCWEIILKQLKEK